MPKAVLTILYVADPTASADFYRRLLGREPFEASPGFVMFPLAEGMRLGLWRASEIAPAATPVGGAEIDFVVDDVDASHDEWVASGAPVALAPTDLDFGRSFVGLDPDGHRLRFYRPAVG